MVHLVYCDNTGKKGERVLDKIIVVQVFPIITKNPDFKVIINWYVISNNNERIL